MTSGYSPKKPAEKHFSSAASSDLPGIPIRAAINGIHSGRHKKLSEGVFRILLRLVAYRKGLLRAGFDAPAAENTALLAEPETPVPV